MSHYETDAEQVERLRKWWKEYGWALIVGVAIAIIIVVGWQVYTRYEQHKAQHASLIYATMMSNSHDGQMKSATEAAKSLTTDFSGTAYADLARLWMAKQAVKNHQYDDALADLQHVQVHGKMSSLREMANLARAEILLQLKQPEQALATLGQIYDKAYIPRVDEMKGDIYFFMKKYTQARQSYQAAKAAFDRQGIPSTFVQMKLASVPYQSSKDNN